MTRLGNVPYKATSTSTMTVWMVIWKGVISRISKLTSPMGSMSLIQVTWLSSPAECSRKIWQVCSWLRWCCPYFVNYLWIGLTTASAGIILEGDCLLPSVKETLSFFSSQNKWVNSSTNKPSQLRQTQAQIFAKPGIPVHENEIFSSSYSAAV